MPTIRERNGRHQAIVRIKRDGVIVHQETETFSTYALAKDWGTRVEARIRLQGLPQRQLTTQTLGTLLMGHLERLQEFGNPRRTAVSELGQLAGDPKLRAVKLSELTPSVFTEFAAARRRAGAGPATVLHNLATLRSVLGATRALTGLDVRGDLVSEAIEALSRTGVVARSQSLTTRVSPQEEAALVAEFERVRHYPGAVLPMHKIVPLAIALPRRLGELTEMRWGDYSKEKRTMLLRDTKHPVKPRDELVPVPPAAMAIIGTLPVLDERILPYKAESVSAAFQRARNRLKMPELHFHTLRHEGITRLFEAGHDITEVALISGHTNWSTLRRYSHRSVEAFAEKLHAHQ